MHDERHFFFYPPFISSWGGSFAIEESMQLEGLKTQSLALAFGVAINLCVILTQHTFGVLYT